MGDLKQLSTNGIILKWTYSLGANRVKKTIHSEAQKVFCEMLRGERKRAKLTQTALSERLKRPQSFVAKVERGERRLDVIEFVRYSLALGFNASAFVKRLQGAHALKN